MQKEYTLAVQLAACRACATLKESVCGLWASAWQLIPFSFPSSSCSCPSSQEGAGEYLNCVGGKGGSQAPYGGLGGACSRESRGSCCTHSLEGEGERAA